jgi:hypothetical protein
MFVLLGEKNFAVHHSTVACEVPELRLQVPLVQNRNGKPAAAPLLMQEGPRLWRGGGDKREAMCRFMAKM